MASVVGGKTHRPVTNWGPFLLSFCPIHSFQYQHQRYAQYTHTPHHTVD